MSRINMCGLEAFTIISSLLYMSDRRAEKSGTILLSNGKQCDLTVKLNKFFNNKLTNISTATTATIFPGMFQFIGTFHQWLTFAGRRHQRLHHTWKTNFSSSLFQFFQRSCIKVLSRFQAQLLSCQITNSFTIHCKVYCTRTGHYLYSLLFKVI